MSPYSLLGVQRHGHVVDGEERELMWHVLPIVHQAGDLGEFFVKSHEKHERRVVEMDVHFVRDGHERV